MTAVNKRGGYIYHTEGLGEIFVIKSEVALGKMFGFATDLRGLTVGQGEFSMEYKKHAPVDAGEQPRIIAEIRAKRREQN